MDHSVLQNLLFSPSLCIETHSEGVMYKPSRLILQSFTPPLQKCWMQKKVMKVVQGVKYLSVGVKDGLVSSDASEWGVKLLMFVKFIQENVSLNLAWMNASFCLLLPVLESYLYSWSHI